MGKRKKPPRWKFEQRRNSTPLLPEPAREITEAETMIIEPDLPLTPHMTELLLWMAKTEANHRCRGGETNTAMSLGRRGLALTWADHTGSWAQLTEEGRERAAALSSLARSGESATLP